MRTLVALMTLLAVGHGALAAGDDREAARAVILRQQDAFRHDDAAAPTPRRRRHPVDLRESRDLHRHGPAGLCCHLPQPPLRVRHRRGPARRSLAQGVRIQDQDGTDWEALYTLERDGDGAWRITGCRLRKAPGSSA